MQDIRSFVAIPLPAALQKSAGHLIQRLELPGSGIKWVPHEHLHLTLKFLGDVDNREIPKVCSVVRECCTPSPPFELIVSGVGAFPDPTRPRVVYAGISEGGEHLKAIVDRLEAQLAQLGFKPEARDYVPHLTLGRARGGSRRGSSELAAVIHANNKARLGSFMADRVLIMASFLDKEGPTYQVMDTIPLGNS